MPTASPVRRHALVASALPPTRQFLRTHLGRAGFAIDEAADGVAALERAHRTAFDLIVLDTLVARIDGMTICRMVRAGLVNREAPIVMVSQRPSETDTVLGLESGADDFITSPFATREFMARVAAIIRRQRRSTPWRPRTVGAHGIELDLDRRQLVVRGAPVPTTRQEFDVLVQLASRPGIVLGREALLSHITGGAVHVTTRTIDTVISRLRRKVERDPADPRVILTAWGVGYKFADLE